METIFYAAVGLLLVALAYLVMTKKKDAYGYDSFTYRLRWPGQKDGFTYNLRWPGQKDGYTRAQTWAINPTRNNYDVMVDQRYLEDVLGRKTGQ